MILLGRVYGQIEALLASGGSPRIGATGLATSSIGPFTPTRPGTRTPRTPWARIDFILTSRQMAENLCHCDVVPRQEMEDASNHLPIWATFPLTGGRRQILR